MEKTNQIEKGPLELFVDANITDSLSTARRRTDSAFCQNTTHQLSPGGIRCSPAESPSREDEGQDLTSDFTLLFPTKPGVFRAACSQDGQLRSSCLQRCAHTATLTVSTRAGKCATDLDLDCQAVGSAPTLLWRVFTQ